MLLPCVGFCLYWCSPVCRRAANRIEMWTTILPSRAVELRAELCRGCVGRRRARRRGCRPGRRWNRSADRSARHDRRGCNGCRARRRTDRRTLLHARTAADELAVGSRGDRHSAAAHTACWRATFPPRYAAPRFSRTTSSCSIVGLNSLKTRCFRTWRYPSSKLYGRARQPLGPSTAAAAPPARTNSCPRRNAPANSETRRRERTP